MENNKNKWTRLQKISFRFFFLFLGLTTIFCWELTISITHGLDEDKFHKPLAAPFYWLDKHIYHTGFNPAIHQNKAGDSHFSVVFYLTIFFISVIATIAWSIFDKRRYSYNKLSYWFRVYLRNMLAIDMLAYSIIKLIPVQMPYPGAFALTKQYGEQGRFDVFWNFMGTSPGYERFAGLCELVVALLLFSRRTAVAGSLLAIAVLSNVIALNCFYNVQVKISPAQMLLYALFLITPYRKNIAEFVYMKPVAWVAQKRFTFKTTWKKYLLRTIMIVVPLMFFATAFIGLNKNYADQENNSRKQKIYDVTTFIASDTLPPLTTDSLRWKRVILFVNINPDLMVIYNMNDNQKWYKFDIDSSKKIFTLYDNPNDKSGQVFNYNYSSKTSLQFKGKWYGKNIEVLMKEFPVDSMNLKKEKTTLLSD
jgi:hypothetical protein